MKKTMLLTAALILLASPVFAKEYVVKEMSDPYEFSPDKLTIQPGDTVTFVNDQNDEHDVMFVEVPKGVDEMIMSPKMKKEGEKWSYKFTVPGTYNFHCHPHEHRGMTGTLIVGQASKPGETYKMDHHKMAKKMGHKDCACCMNGKDHKMNGECPMMQEKGKADSHDKHHADNTVSSALPTGTGVINSIDAGSHTINVSHDPIKALDWPKMKMQFNVDKKVDLSTFKAGDAISFTLKPEKDDDYTVIQMKKRK